MEPPHKNSCFPAIPEDISRLIFEGLVEDDKCRPIYALISKQVQRWVEPIIYRDIVADSDTNSLHRTVTASVSTKPLDFFALHVKGLFFRVYSVDDQMAAEILERCRSLRYLTIWSYIDPHRDSFPHLQAVLTSRALSPVQMSLSQFSLNPCPMTIRTFTHPILSHITHLDITCRQREDEWDWRTLEVLNSLTHLSIDVYHPDPAHVASEVVRCCPDGLCVLIICISCGVLVSHEARDNVLSLVRGDVDPRVVVASFRNNLDALEFNFRLSFKELLHGWKRPSKGSKLWAVADQVVKERRTRLSEETVPY